MRTANVALVKGGGDLGTGVVLALQHAGWRVLVTELPKPLVVRRTVALATAVYDGRITVEDLTGVLVQDSAGIHTAWERGEVPVLVDPDAYIRAEIVPDVVVDAILAKKNTGTRLSDARLVIGLGPGLLAGADCHAVIETQRGPDLGRLILDGTTAPDSGIPGDIQGETVRRILRAPREGVFSSCRKIGDHVLRGDRVANVDGQPLVSEISGVIRGLVADGLWVGCDLKVGDVDPRDDVRLCFKVSDKARKIGESVLHAIQSVGQMDNSEIAY